MDENTFEDTHDSDARMVAETMLGMIKGDLPPERFAAFEAACDRLDTTGDGFDIDLAAWPDLQPRFAALGHGRSEWSWRDALFFAGMGAILVYALLILGGMVHGGNPNLLDQWRRRIMELNGVA